MDLPGHVVAGVFQVDKTSFCISLTFYLETLNRFLKGTVNRKVALPRRISRETGKEEERLPYTGAHSGKPGRSNSLIDTYCSGMPNLKKQAHTAN